MVVYLVFLRVWKSQRFFGWAAMWVRSAVAKVFPNRTTRSLSPLPPLTLILQASRSTSATWMLHNSLTRTP